MPGEDTHALRAQLAVALKERDEARAELARHETCIADNDKAFDKSLGECLDRAEKAEAERDRLETAARAYIEGHELALSRAEKAESERDSCRTALTDIVTLCMDVPTTEDWRAKVGDKARKALYGEPGWKET